MLAQLVSVACSLALSAPCASTRAEATFRPYLSGFSAITAIASTPAEPRRLYVVEQVGRIRYLVNGRLSGTFLDIRRRVASGGERGLLSVAFSPSYETNHRFYVNYTDLNGNTRLVEYRSRRGKAIPSSARQILFVAQPYPNHNGGQLQFGPDKLLYVGMGDGGSAGDPGNRAQNLSVRLGKLLRTNPYVRRPAWHVVGYGLRNPWRFSFDPANGDLYIADVGQGEWEEVDYRPRSQLNALANYGWNIYEGRARYRSGAPNGAGQLVFPLFAYDHGQGCSISGGYVYRGSAVPAAVGRYYFGDWCSGRIWSLRTNDGSAETRREPGSVGRVTTFGVDNAGELYAGTGGGRIYKLAP
ncbi:MAG TPA: PQQ-dependent sugar dehydrogenase [Gaiellaceae bacterium]|jgi:glucose/arabinose dehydrogenase|nr:PQQ-dependent sugar dehydrogenase [Gaiellaceae bacterium]